MKDMKDIKISSRVHKDLLIRKAELGVNSFDTLLSYYTSFKIKKCLWCKGYFFSQGWKKKYCSERCKNRCDERFKEKSVESKKARIKFNKKRGVVGCEKCGEQNKIVLELHHTIPKYNRNYKERNKMENIKILCANCHKKEGKEV